MNLPLEAEVSSEKRACLRCEGAGTIHRAGFSYERRTYPSCDEKCYVCKGAAVFVPPDEQAIVAEIRGRGGLRSRRPEGDRAYFVWRMARFHGGVDVTMPMVASGGVHYDPYRNELEAIADRVAQAFFGTALAGAHRWGTALGMISTSVCGLPSTAYQGGPVLTGQKPAEEMAEIQ